MPSQALYLRWRPMTFEDVVGQEHVTYTLRNALISERVSHAYLFAGPRGTGKTTLARLLAKAVNCLADDPAARPCNACAYCVAVNEGRFLDLIEIDAASHTGVDDVRELRDRVNFAPNEARYKVYIIDEVHRFSGAAFDALLKTIEEPPPHAIFVLATTEVHKVPATIRSRCQRFDFRRIAVSEIVNRLQAILDSEGIEAEPLALELIARQATGSLRDAISLLDQLLTGPGQFLTLELVQAILGTAGTQAVRDLTAALIEGDTARGLAIINQAIDQGTDARQFAGEMAGHLRRLMLIQTGGTALVEAEVMADELAMLAVQAGQLPRRALLEALSAFNRAASDLRTGWQPQLPLEMAFVESVEALDAASLTGAAPAPAPPASPRVRSRPPVEARPPRPASPGTGTVSLADLQAQWDNFRAAVRRLDPAVQALINSTRPFGVEGSAVLLLVEADFVRQKIEVERNRSIIEEALNQVFGQPLKVRCVTGQPRPAGQPRQADTLLATDDLAAYAVNELGGSIKEFDADEEDESNLE